MGTLALRPTLGALCLALVLTTSGAFPAAAQRKTQEFTLQGLLIGNFAPRPGTDIKTARRATDAVRSRVSKLVNRKEVDVIDGGEIKYRMERAGYNSDTTLSMQDFRAIGKFMRADEFIWATVTNGPQGMTISGELVLYRDERLRQPLPDATAPKLDSAAALFAKSIAAARGQLVPERRCENALREGSASRAVAAAREGITAYPRSSIARTCLVWAQKGYAPHAERFATARELLDIDARNPHGLEAAALAMDSLRRRNDAATYWLRLAEVDTTSELAARVGFALVEGGSADHAVPFLEKKLREYPDDLRFTRLLWRAAYEIKNWSVAIGAGEVLLAQDSLARADSIFFLRLATSYRNFDKPLKAIETLARGVSSFPKDVRLYSLYTQYIKAEADTVVPRGLALFPKSADLLALNAKDLRAKGKIGESLDATKRAVELDSAMSQGQLMVAQLEIELGRPDSALAALHRAVANGQDSALVAQFALSKGNTLYRAANATKTSGDFQLALRFLMFSDSVRSTEQSRFLSGATALGVAQAALTEAAKSPDKAEGCRLAKLGNEFLPMARTGLKAGEQTFGDAAKQSLDYLDQFEPFVQQQLKIACPETPPAPSS
jgi:tetratricopeptide (TPR) repeat protein